jgi:hypothetical protein
MARATIRETFSWTGGHMLARSVVITVLAISALAIHPALGAETAATLEMSADGEVQIAADGSVSDYRLQSKLVPTVAELVDKDVRGWRFEPVVVDGVPVVAKTTMHLALKAEPVDDKGSYRIRIVNVRFGEPRRNGQMRPPRYPVEAIREHLGAKVLLAVRLDETGKVVDAQAYQTSLDMRWNSENDAERWRKLFEHASIAAARNWHYDLSETINGKTIGTSAIVPIIFSLNNVAGSQPQEGTWKAYQAGPLHPAPWMNTKMLADAGELSSLRDDESVSLDSAFRLKDDVVGKAL